MWKLLGRFVNKQVNLRMKSGLEYRGKLGNGEAGGFELINKDEKGKEIKEYINPEQIESFKVC